MIRSKFGLQGSEHYWVILLKMAPFSYEVVVKKEAII